MDSTDITDTCLGSIREVAASSSRYRGSFSANSVVVRGHKCTANCVEKSPTGLYGTGEAVGRICRLDEGGGVGAWPERAVGDAEGATLTKIGT